MFNYIDSGWLETPKVDDEDDASLFIAGDNLSMRSCLMA
jgi:hypothetical protein